MINNEERWIKNLNHLKNGDFGDPTQAETLLRYWRAQECAGYPYANENVKYFEKMVERERCKTEMPK